MNQYSRFDQWGLAYDKKGNSTQKGTQQLAYDYRNQLDTAKDAPSNTQVEMRYDVLGIFTGTCKIFARGNKDVFTYDNRDLLVNKSLGNGLTNESYSYSANGNIQNFTDGENKVYTYVHDSHGRMKEVIDPLGNKVVYNYDDNSNIIQRMELVLMVKHLTRDLIMIR